MPAEQLGSQGSCSEALWRDRASFAADAESSVSADALKPGTAAKPGPLSLALLPCSRRLTSLLQCEQPLNTCRRHTHPNMRTTVKPERAASEKV